MGSAVKVRVGSRFMCIGRELSNYCVGISCCSFPDFFFFKGMLSSPSPLINCFLWGKTSVQISSSKKKICQTITSRDWMLGIIFCFPPMVISGLLWAGDTAWRYRGPPAEGSPDAWLFQGGRHLGKPCLYVGCCCRAAQPYQVLPRSDTAPMRDYLGCRNENFWGWTVPRRREKTGNSTVAFFSCIFCKRKADLKHSWD